MSAVAQVRLRQLAERGRASSPPRIGEPAPAADACPLCRSRFDELIARDQWPAELEVERCSCRAVLSYRFEVEPGVWERRRIERHG